MSLVDRFYGRILTPQFKEQCDAYRFHVKEWEMMWTHVFDTHALPDSVNVSGALLAPKFPAGLQKALDDEIAGVKRLAG